MQLLHSKSNIFLAPEKKKVGRLKVGEAHLHSKPQILGTTKQIESDFPPSTIQQAKIKTLQRRGYGMLK